MEFFFLEMQSSWYPHVRIFQQQANNLQVEPTKNEGSKKWLGKKLKGQLIRAGNMPEISLQEWLRGRNSTKYGCSFMLAIKLVIYRELNV